MKPPDPIDRKILARLQGDLPVEKNPFDGWAREIGIGTLELIERLKALREQGIVREVKAVLRHRSAGFGQGAMVAWAVPEESVEKTGRELAGMKQVSHCYDRPGFGEYRLFTMIHGRSRQEVENAVWQISAVLGIGAYRVYWSIQELKKSSMEYFREDLT